MLVTGSGGSAGNNVSWSLRVSSDGRALSLTGTNTDRTSLELNRSHDNAYKIPNASDPRYLIILNKIIRRQKVEGIFPNPTPNWEPSHKPKEKYWRKHSCPTLAP